MRKVIAPESAAPIEAGHRPTFSVLIPAFQAADTIAEAIESALSQITPPLDVIVCDDGSTDDLASAIAPYRDRIEFIRKEHGGGASALNGAAASARGDFVAILDADDVYAPERLDALGDLAAARPDLDVLGTDAWYVSGGRRAGRFNGKLNPFPAENQRTTILRRCFRAAPVFRRRRLLEGGGWDESLPLAFDWDCVLRVILGGAVAGLVAEPLYEYRLKEDSLSARRLESFRDRVAMLEKNALNPALREEERPALDAALEHHRRNLALAEAKDLTLSAAPGFRKRWIAIARESVLGRRMRLRALVLSSAPSPVARAMVARARQEGRSRAASRKTPE